jgi:hypothetical protein
MLLAVLPGPAAYLWLLHRGTCLHRVSRPRTTGTALGRGLHGARPGPVCDVCCVILCWSFCECSCYCVMLCCCVVLAATSCLLLRPAAAAVRCSCVLRCNAGLVTLFRIRRATMAIRHAHCRALLRCHTRGSAFTATCRWDKLQCLPLRPTALPTAGGGRAHGAGPPGGKVPAHGGWGAPPPGPPPPPEIRIRPRVAAVAFTTRQLAWLSRVP